MDIKPDNIFISYDGICKLGDFGLVVDLKKSDLKEVQEGDPKYLAPEVLNNNNNITFAADIFSLGMTILELATDLDLPRGGDPWHQLRNNQIPQHLVSSLSKDLVEIIMKMIERDHIKRANVDELLNMPKIRRLISAKKRKLFYSNIQKSLKFIYNNLYSFTLTLWCLMICPWIKLVNYVNMNKIDYNVNNNNLSDENCQTTSTPKKNAVDNNADDNNTAQLLLMHHDDDDDHNYIYNDNDSFNNNSHLSPYVDTSSSFSDNSEFSLSHRYRDGALSARKSRTEPPLNKLHKQILKYSPTVTNNGSVTPPTSRTPPWKPITNFSSNDSTPIRHKLVFDDEKDKIFENISNREAGTTKNNKQSSFK
jgi:serine/threonine protein kinase